MIRHQFQHTACLLLVLLFAGCSSFDRHRGDDSVVIRHHTWWNYYERGRLYFSRQEYDLAAQDFETALGIRKGARQAYPHDRWRVRTYGMHTLESYFPHRELGVCLYFQNRLPESQELLETSMQMEPSARTKFYLNRVRKDLALAAAPPPQLDLRPFTLWTADRNVHISGEATGSNAIADITINETPEYLEMAQAKIHFERNIKLVEGSNTISIVATDVSEKTCITNLTILADFSPPRVQLSRTGATLDIICRDNMGLANLVLNGKSSFPRNQKHILSVPLPTKQGLSLSLRDYAGNRLEWELSAQEVEHVSSQRPSGPPKISLAHAGQSITLFKTEYELDIRAEDDTALTSLQVNEQDLLDHPSPLFRASRRMPLALGTNLFSVVAKDNDGNFTEQQITIIRRQPEYLDSRYRLSAVQFPITGELTQIQVGPRINGMMSHELSSVPPRFFMLATADEEDRLKDELNLSAGEMSDPRAMLKAGNRLEAELLFRTRTLEDAPGRTIYTQVYSVDEKRELFAEDVYYEDPAELATQIQGLIMKIEQRFPLVKAHVSRLENQMTIDAGSEQGLTEGMRFLVIQSDRDFDSGHVLVHKDHPSELIISEIESTTARVILHKRHSEGKVKNGDFVFSR